MANKALQRTDGYAAAELGVMQLNRASINSGFCGYIYLDNVKLK